MYHPLRTYKYAVKVEDTDYKPFNKESPTRRKEEEELMLQRVARRANVPAPIFRRLLRDMYSNEPFIISKLKDLT
tara:strand:- start:968 stop:1192 length:225 start_codon:yes stop_codon:yes gene_type:complete